MRTKHKIKWLYKAPEKATPRQALLIACRVLKHTDAAHIAMALRDRPKYPGYPADYCGLTTGIRKVLKHNTKGDEVC